MRKLSLRVQAARQDQELGIIWGYASVADILDEQGDLIPQDELIRAVYEFMENYYRGETTIRVNHGSLRRPSWWNPRSTCWGPMWRGSSA